MADYVVAQLNIAKMRYDIEAPEMKDFVANLDRINAMAEQAPGFVWRLIGDGGAEANVFEDDILVNFSSWTDVQSLHDYVFTTAHVDIMRRRKEWFDTLDTHSVMWWHHNVSPPSLTEARKRLTLLANHGPTPEAFTFKRRFDKPETA